MAWQPRPNTHGARILEYLRAHPEGATDAELARAFGTSHATVNMNCRHLESRGLIARRVVGGTIRNALVSGPDSRGTPGASAAPRPKVAQAERQGVRSWYWEGNVQAAAVASLVRDGWSIRRVADTASREHGKDVEAWRDGVTAWVTAKGFPESTDRTTALAQARVWFQSVIFDVILWHQENASARVLVALPRMQTYQSLAERTTWFQEAAGFSYLWVTEQGVEQP